MLLILYRFSHFEFLCLTISGLSHAPGALFESDRRNENEAGHQGEWNTILCEDEQIRENREMYITSAYSFVDLHICVLKSKQHKRIVDEQTEKKKKRYPQVLDGGSSSGSF